MNGVLSPLGMEKPFALTSLLNFGGQFVNYPLVIGVLLIVFGVASLLHLLLVSVARRRREIATLKCLGLFRRQVTTVIDWQAITVVVVAARIGTPIGIVLGRAAWVLFASNYGVASVFVVSWWQEVGIVASSFLLVVAIALLPSRYAVRLEPGSVLGTG